ncbi:adenylyl-sulfate kinase [Weeksellaceae bacterium KMM 9724]|uniref:adenylyl-sulfate kinase n=1 Tax=Profundicola chukchiensis TaxID=2961959 RepID=UPI00243876F3|nr:adenylyl-sulfate kinase [Profundicola chukchiensis]MDG4949899.1 adenylyl-sulfate kinase [Profundicola chukchiensis]
MSENIHRQDYKVNRSNREHLHKHQAKVIWLSGLSGSGKSTLANSFEVELHQKGFKTYVLDGDNIRLGLNQDLKFSDEDRKENLRRISEVAKLFVDAGIVVIAAFITPFEADRIKIKEIIGADNFLHVFVDSPLEVCESRDVKGLYAKARAGEIQQFTGIDSPFEVPEQNDLVLKTGEETQEESLAKLLKLALENIEHQL